MINTTDKRLFGRKTIHAGRKEIHLVQRANPKLKKVYLTKPNGLSEVQSMVWDFMSKHLGDNYLADEIDVFSLKLFCETVEEFYKVNKQLETEGYYYVTNKGDRRVNPLYKIRNDLYSLILRFVQEFGLSPKARKKFAVARGNKIEDEYLEELNKVEPDDLMELMGDYASKKS